MMGVIEESQKNAEIMRRHEAHEGFWLLRNTQRYSGGWYVGTTAPPIFTIYFVFLISLLFYFDI